MYAKLDSGATSHYFKPTHQNILTNIKPLKNGPNAILPDNTMAKATKQGTIKLHDDLNTNSQEVYIMPHLKNESLISVGKLCDDNCTVTFTKNKVDIIKNNKTLLEGERNKNDGLWDIQLKPNITPTQNYKINYIVQKEKTKYELAQYLHACAFSPAVSTFQKAIKNGHFITWPGISTINFKNILPTTIATEKGHLDQERKNLQSTKISKQEINDDDMFPQQSIIKNSEIFGKMFNINEIGTNKTYADLTGKFPHKSSRGYQYILVMYDYDSNAIIVEALKTRQAKEITTAFEKCTKRIIRCNDRPTLFIMDNECSTDLKLSILKNNNKYELVPPHQHRRNAAEKAIRTFKNHLLAGLATCDQNFPICEWDRLLPQCEITLNLLRTSRLQPKLSAYAFLNDNYDFNKTPLAPPGTKVMVHSKPSKRASFAYHGQEGWYIGPSLEHYRCVKCYMPSTHAEVDADTVKFIPNVVPIPEADISTHLKNSVNDLVHLLAHPNKHLPLLQNQTSRNALITIAKLLNSNQNKVQSLTSEGDKTINTKPKQKQQTLKTRDKTKLNSHTIVQSNKTPVTTLGKPRLSTSYHSIPSKQSLIPILRAQSIVQYINHIYNNNGQRQSLDKLLQGDNKLVWSKGLTNELGRIAQGVHDIIGNDTVDYIHKSDVPPGAIVTYANFICDYRPLKEEQYRVRLTVGGDMLEYLFDATSPAANLIETKLLLNSTISRSSQGARFMTIDIKDFFLQSYMKHPEYMRIHKKYFTDAIRQKYNINDLIGDDDYVYCRIKRGMYGLKQAARLAYDELVQHLKKFGYEPDKYATNLWSHTTRKTKFCLCVDDFGIQYFNNDDANHLISALQAKYKITIDKKGQNFCGLNLKWNYARGYVDISMDGFVKNLLSKLNHQPRKKQFAPHEWNVPIYGKNKQYAQEEDTEPVLGPSTVKYVQKVVGSLLYYARAIDNTILPAVNTIALSQTKPTNKTIKKVNMLLNYVHTYPNPKVRYYASDMRLHIDSDAAYLIAPKAKSRISGYYYCSKNTKPNEKVPLNGPILVECKLLQHVVTSAAEAETAALFYNCQNAIHLRQMLNALGHPQTTTHVKTDNATAASFVNSTFKQKRSKAWDVRYHWLTEQSNLKTFLIYWAKGIDNLADYHSKHHAPQHHKKMRETYILKNHNVSQKYKINNRTFTGEGVFIPVARTVRRNVPVKVQRPDQI